MSVPKKELQKAVSNLGITVAESVIALTVPTSVSRYRKQFKTC